MSIVFEQPVTPIRRRRGPLPQLIALALVTLIGLAVLKPWAEADPSVATTPSASAAAVAVLSGSPSASTIDGFGGRPRQLGPTATSPAIDEVISPSLETIDLIVARFVKRGGVWGVGSGGSGPRMVRDDPWVDWSPVHPESSGSIPDYLAVWPGTGICHDTPVLFDRPALVAVTVPGGLVPDWTVAGWWTDGVAIDDLSGTIHQVSPPGNRTITYLQRNDGGTWPSGRYEFHVASGGHEIALTVCLGKNGQA